MQATGSTAMVERRRVEAVVETLAAIHNHGESLGELAHDARNMVTALSLYCDLLEEPGVLSAAHRHYGSELRLVAEASRRLVEKLALHDGSKQPEGQPPSASSRQGRFLTGPRSELPLAMLRPEPMGVGLIDDLRAELLAVRNLLAAIAGPSILVTVDAGGGASPVQMTSENLIRALVNLVKNAAECIAGAGAVRLELTDAPCGAGESPSVILSIEDTGCGIPEEFLDKVFEPGFTTRASAPSGARWESAHRGLGLAITRSIVEAAGGRIHAGNRAGHGAHFLIELPVRRP